MQQPLPPGQVQQVQAARVTQVASRYTHVPGRKRRVHCAHRLSAPYGPLLATSLANSPRNTGPALMATEQNSHQGLACRGELGMTCFLEHDLGYTSHSTLREDGGTPGLGNQCQLGLVRGLRSRVARRPPTLTCDAWGQGPGRAARCGQCSCWGGSLDSLLTHILG